MLPSCVCVTARPRDPQISRYCSNMNDPNKGRSKRLWSLASAEHQQPKSIMDDIAINADHFLLVGDKCLGVGGQCIQAECFGPDAEEMLSNMDRLSTGDTFQNLVEVPL